MSGNGSAHRPWRSARRAFERLIPFLCALWWMASGTGSVAARPPGAAWPEPPREAAERWRVAWVDDRGRPLAIFEAWNEPVATAAAAAAPEPPGPKLEARWRPVWARDGTMPRPGLISGRRVPALRLTDGDCNADGRVDARDLRLLASEWGRCAAFGVRADFDGDGIVGSGDLIPLLQNWQPGGSSDEDIVFVNTTDVGYGCCCPGGTPPRCIECKAIWNDCYPRHFDDGDDNDAPDDEHDGGGGGDGDTTGIGDGGLDGGGGGGGGGGPGDPGDPGDPSDPEKPTYDCDDFKIDLVLDRATHESDATTLMLLPGDVEVVEVIIHGPSLQTDEVEFVVSDPNAARIQNQDGEWVALVRRDELARDDSGRPQIRIRGYSAGASGSTASLIVSIPSAGGNCATFGIRVGGSLIVEYGHSPTQKTMSGALRGGPRGPPGAGSPQVEGAVRGGQFDLGLDGRPLTEDAMLRAEAVGDPWMARFRLTLLDADGHPKPGRPIKLEVRPENLSRGVVGAWTDSGRSLTWTGPDGRASVSLGVELVSPADPQAGVLGAVNVGFVAGEMARALDGQSSLLEAPAAERLARAITEQTFPEHRFRGWGLRDRGTLAFGGDEPIPLRSLRLPILNHAHVMFLIHWAERPLWAEEPEQSWDGRTLVLPDPETGLPFAWDVPPDPVRPLSVPTIVVLVRDELAARLPAVDFTLPQPEDSPPGWEERVLTVSAIVTEIAISLVPGADFKDVVIETIWNPAFRGQQTNWWVAGISFIGLVADAGYLTGPFGVTANFVAGALKAIFKFLPPEAIRAAFHLASNATDSILALGHYIGRFSDEGLAGIQAWASRAQQLLTTWIQTLRSHLGLNADDLMAAVGVVTTRAQRNFTADATEGLAFLAKHGKKQAVEVLFGDFADDVIEAGCDAARKLDLPSGVISDEAVKGIAVAIEAVQPTSPLVREFLEGAAINAERANKAFGNLSELRHVDGLEDMVQFFRNNRNNANGIDGVIYESTVARRIRAGEVPGSGSLQRVSHDGIPGANRIDTTTDSLAIQVKHRRAEDGVFTPSDFGGSVAGALEYLDQLRDQAIRLDKQPAVVTNRSINGDLQSMLTERGIVWIQVID